MVGIGKFATAPKFILPPLLHFTWSGAAEQNTPQGKTCDRSLLRSSRHHLVWQACRRTLTQVERFLP